MKITKVKPLQKYPFEGGEIDSVELKALIVSRGVKVREDVYSRFSDTHRLSKDPLQCNAMRLPDGTVVQLTDLSFHMEYIGKAINWDMLNQLRYLSDLKTDFSLRLDDEGNPVLFHKDQKVTRVSFLKKTDFYRQKTSTGLPYSGNAVLQGLDWLSFPLLWKCDYAWQGQPCQYCFSGGELASLSKRNKPVPAYPTPDEIAEIVEYAVIKDHCANSIQITGGSMFDSQHEIDMIHTILQTIDARVGKANIKGEIVVYVTAPKDKTSIGQLFDAGADRVSCSFEIWDEELAAKIMPGKMKYTGRQRIMDCLLYGTEKFGKNKMCSNFIIGLEPVESVVQGAEFLASHGVVPIASVWIPFGRPVLNSMKARDLNYYRLIKEEFSRIYTTYGIRPPGASGLNVCFCRDIFMSTLSDETAKTNPEM